MKNIEIVETFLNGFNNPDLIQQSLDLLAEDYKFNGPMSNANSKTEFIQLAQQVGASLTGLRVIRAIENGNWVSVLYEFRTSIPGLESNLGTEWFRLDEGKIQESQLIYDATGWHKLYS